MSDATPRRPDLAAIGRAVEQEGDSIGGMIDLAERVPDLLAWIEHLEAALLGERAARLFAGYASRDQIDPQYWFDWAREELVKEGLLGGVAERQS
ncbi:MAG TPA: hypothetical protein VF041_23300 [Gemmatimonadaceae bacterium]